MSANFENVVKRLMNQNPNPNIFLKELGIAIHAEDIDEDAKVFLSKLIRYIGATGTNDACKQMLQRWIISCDGIRVASWTGLTESNTQERRNLIYSQLELDDEDIEILQAKLPPRTHGNPIIAVDHENWYTEDRKSKGHYGPSLIKYLEGRGWTPQNIGLIDEASDDIIGNIADPDWALDPLRQNSTFACRGLVVGYVQSGKTTTINLTTAKAIDAGYRLVIIMSGMTNLLRKQTQRRLDKEVIGKDFLMEDPDFLEPDGYGNAEDWESFIEHPEPNIGSQARDIERLTTLKFDFSSPRGGSVLSNSWVNSESSSKIVVVKKHKGRLENLNRELKRLGVRERNKLSVLILDDESDQASINTNDPKNVQSKPENKKRTAINQEIVQMLRLLPRAQYVGVTATPVANCFIDPRDANDLYPRNFILPLARPEGYMGILDFHDLDDDLEPIPNDLPQPKKARHIRNIKHQPNEDDEELTNALDTWIIAGALKLYRGTTGVYKGRHHTLFYSDSTARDAHQRARERILRLWPNLGYLSVSGWKRLEKCYREEIIHNSEYQGNEKYFPRDFEALKPFISEAIQKVDTQFEEHDVVLIVNSSEYSANLDFDLQEIWKIVVGGTKLSRGYTIEGLTVTYFRRKSNNEAALMQMGRWFGYREGYRDLIRLWISRAEPARPAPIDIYARYEAVCIDEEKLRRRFNEWYSEPLRDGTRVTPLMVRPLIEQFDTNLLPVARNQMWNVEIVSKIFQDIHTNTKMSRLIADREKNEKLFRNLFESYTLDSDKYFGEYLMFYAVVPHKEILRLIELYSRPPLRNENSEEVFFRKFLASEDCKVSDWLVMVPQLASTKSNGTWDLNDGKSLTISNRSWRDEVNQLVNTIGVREERIAARVITKTPQSKDVNENDLKRVSKKIHELAVVENRAVLVLRPFFTETPADDQGIPYMGYEIFLPARKGGYAFRTKNPDGPPLLEGNR